MRYNDYQLKENYPINSQQATTSTAKRKAAFPTIIGLAAIIFALDQATKFLVVRNIPFRESWGLFQILDRVARSVFGTPLPEFWEPLLAIDKLLKFTFISNTGAAFGMFPQLGAVFMVIAIFVIAGIIIFYDRLPTGTVWIRISLGLQLGGAMGNLLDRILRGYVVDFVDIGFWPIFNIADLSIVVGVAILAYYLWDEETNANSTQEIHILSERRST